MSVCFYNNAGTMNGLDPHEYFALVPPNLGPTPAFTVYVVSAPFSWFSATFWKRTGTVRSDRFPMLQGGFDLYQITHIPVPILPPHLAQVFKNAEIIAESGSKAQMQVHSVTGEGSALATCVDGAVGVNMNCIYFGLSAPIGRVMNPNSVITQPTKGDYWGAIVGGFVDSILGAAIDKLGPIKHLWRRVGDLPFASILDVPSHIQNFVQRLIDDGPDAAVEGLVEDAKKSITDPIDKAKELMDKYLK
jgi:hypothetical protein